MSKYVGKSREVGRWMSQWVSSEMGREVIGEKGGMLV